MRKSLKTTALAGLLIFGSLTTACIGSFNLTGNLYRWNTSIENKWGQEGVFLVCTLLPIYGLCMLGDAIIFNTIEFWGGDNPVGRDAMGPQAEVDNVAALMGLPVNVTVLPTP